MPDKADFIESINERDFNLVESFLESLVSERNVSLNTVVSYRFDLIRFLRFLYTTQCCATEVTFGLIEKYIQSLQDSNLSVASIQRATSAIKQFYSFLSADDIISKNPTDLIARKKSSRPLPKTLSIADIKNLFLATDQLNYDEAIRAKLILLLLYGSGLRVSELINLKITAFSENNVRIYGKGSKERLVPIAHGTLDLILEYTSITKSKNFLFPSANGKTLTRQRIFQIIKHLTTIANIPYENISPHVLRHAFASHILNNGGDLLSIKKMLGHKSISTTEIYTHIAKDRLRTILLQKHPLNKLLENNENE